MTHVHTHLPPYPISLDFRTNFKSDAVVLCALSALWAWAEEVQKDDPLVPYRKQSVLCIRLRGSLWLSWLSLSIFALYIGKKLCRNTWELSNFSVFFCNLLQLRICSAWCGRWCCTNSTFYWCSAHSGCPASGGCSLQCNCGCVRFRLWILS